MQAGGRRFDSVHLHQNELSALGVQLVLIRIGRSSEFVGVTAGGAIFDMVKNGVSEVALSVGLSMAGVLRLLRERVSSCETGYLRGLALQAMSFAIKRQGRAFGGCLGTERR